MTLTDTRPQHRELESARRDDLRLGLHIATGHALCIGGIAGLVAVLLSYASLGEAATGAQDAGTLMLAAVAFAVSAWGTDYRHRAQRARAALRSRIALLEAGR